MSDYNLKIIIESAFIIGKDAITFDSSELVTLAEAAIGEHSETKPKSDWTVVDFEDGFSLVISPKHYDKVMRGYDIARAIYKQSMGAGISYASELEYFCLVLRILHCISKCAIII